MLRKNIYKWHRTLSLIIAVPLLLWAASGFMHPLMTNIRPKVSTQWLSPVVIDSSKMKVPLQVALQQNHIDSFSSFRIIHIADNWFYQVQLTTGKEPVYLATLTGKALTAGDWIYAQYLAKQFLEGQEKDSSNMKALSMNMPMSTQHDCCDAATDLVINSSKGTKVKNASAITAFDNEYKSINRLLPVYRVAFDKPDGIRIYVETTQDRFAFAMDNRRRIFDRLFTLIHTWGWLDFMGKGKLAVEFLLASLAFLSACMGIYIFFSTNTKKINGNALNKTRRLHRYTSIVIVLFTLMFTFSGAYHALSKFKEDTRSDYFIRHPFYTSQIKFNFSELQSIAKDPVVNAGIIHMETGNYWRLMTRQGDNNDKRKDLMKTATAPLASTIYISVDSLTILKEGETKYARFLATTFSGKNDAGIISTEPVTKFTGEYNFSDKRLPVWKISYAKNDERYFVETSTGRLSKKLTSMSQAQDYSFAFFHKHEFLSWAGKGWKDFSTMFWAMGQIVMVIIGLVFYFKQRRARETKMR